MMMMAMTTMDWGTIIHPSTYPEEPVQSAILHVLRDDHRGTGHADHAHQPNHVVVIELTHDARFGQKIQPAFVGRTGLQGLHGHQHPGTVGSRRVRVRLLRLRTVLSHHVPRQTR